MRSLRHLAVKLFHGNHDLLKVRAGRVNETGFQQALKPPELVLYGEGKLRIAFRRYGRNGDVFDVCFRGGWHGAKVNGGHLRAL